MSVEESLKILHDNIKHVIHVSGIFKEVFYYLIGFTEKQIDKFEKGDVGFLRISHIAKINAMFRSEVIKINLNNG